MLFLEFHGSPSSVQEQAQTVQEIAHDHGGEEFVWTTNTEDRTKLWAARHHAYFACLHLRPGTRAFATDACVPLSKLAQCIEETIDDFSKSPLIAPVFGHVGDGNFHCVILANPEDPAELEEAERLNQRIMRRAIALEGTCTGEHGVGRHKIDLLREELGDDAVAFMRQMKGAWDPHNLMNPGKVVRVRQAAA
jgi:D-lactate dehydrogenase (cytochrome)